MQLTAIGQLVIDGCAGRAAAAIEHDIAELAAIGVPHPSAVPPVPLLLDLVNPVLGRAIRHRSTLDALAEVA